MSDNSADYEQKYLIGTGIAKVQNEALRGQLLDFAVNSGPYPAISYLQKILGITADGILGPLTLALVNKADARLLGNALVAERIKMIGRVVSKTPSQLRFLNGWLARAIEFLG